MTSKDKACLNHLRDMFSKHNLVIKMGAFSRSLNPDSPLTCGVDLVVQMYHTHGVDSMLFTNEAGASYSHFFDLFKVLKWQAARDKMTLLHPYEIDDILKDFAFLMRKYTFSLFAYALQADRMRGAVYGPRTYVCMQSGCFLVEHICNYEAFSDIVNYQEYLASLTKEKPNDN